MKHVIILVEGQTEETFVKEILQPYLQSHLIWITPTIINTRIIKDGNNFKGGAVSFDKVERDLQRILKDKSVYVTTFFDYYRLNKDFPQYKLMPQNGHIYERIIFLESAFEENIKNPRFKAYIQPYEFEALLFADISGFKNIFSDEPKFIDSISEIMMQYPNPEEINDGVMTAPSKRLEFLLQKKYEKIFHGNMIALENGIDVIIQKCKHFSNWIEWLISLKNLN